MTGARIETSRTRVAVPSPELLEAEIGMLNVPEPIGIPEITPVEVLTDSPAGRPVARKRVG